VADGECASTYNELINAFRLTDFIKKRDPAIDIMKLDC
jgi:hypothetical protein